jgi:hypothetical protein
MFKLGILWVSSRLVNRIFQVSSGFSDLIGTSRMFLRILSGCRRLKIERLSLTPTHTEICFSTSISRGPSEDSRPFNDRVVHSAVPSIKAV